MCPTANEAFFPLESQTFNRRVIKPIGAESPLGWRQLQLDVVCGIAGDDGVYA
jgi:hypothetical protein